MTISASESNAVIGVVMVLTVAAMQFQRMAQGHLNRDALSKYDPEERRMREFWVVGPILLPSGRKYVLARNVNLVAAAALMAAIYIFTDRPDLRAF